MSGAEMSKKRRYSSASSPISEIVNLTEDSPLQDVPSDTALVILSIEAMSRNGFVFLHQVYSLLENRTAVDTEISELRNNFSYKVLNCNFIIKGQSTFNSSIIMKTKAFVESVRVHMRRVYQVSVLATDDELLCRKFSIWLSQSSKVSMMRRDLKHVECATTEIPDCQFTGLGKRGSHQNNTDNIVGGNLSLNDLEIDKLIQLGFLHYRNNVMPAAGVDYGMPAEVSVSSYPPASSASSFSIERDNELYWLAHPAMR
jgi:hypothetical protein